MVNRERARKSEDKPQVSTVFIGHIDSGKSTLVGRILLDTGVVNEREYAKRLVEAEILSKKTFGLAHIMDDLKEERERGVTIRTQVQRFETPQYIFAVGDAPGHRDYLDNMIRGTSQAQAAVLLVNANIGKGIENETKQHTILAKTFGVNQLVVAVNQMDATFPPFSETRYNNLIGDVEHLLKSVGFSKKQYKIVPISGYEGDNVSSRSKNMKWYSGPTLLEVLDSLEPPKSYEDLPLRWPMTELMRVPRSGFIPTGYVFTGTLSVGDEIIFRPGGTDMPEGYRAVVKSLEKYREPIEIARPGDTVGAGLRVVGDWVKTRKTLHPGYVAGHLDNLPTVADSFTANITVFDHPNMIVEGYSAALYAHKAKVNCFVERLDAKLDPRDLSPMPEKPSYIQNGDLARVTFRPIEPIVIEKFSEFPPLGRFAIRDNMKTIAAGIVMDIKKKD